MSVSIDGAGSLIGVDQGLNIVGLTTLTGGIHVTGGSVGIGTNSPSQELEVFSDDFTGIRLKSTRTGLTQQIGGVGFSTSSDQVATINALVDGTFLIKNTINDTERLRITSGGNIGINTTNPTSYGNSQATLVIEDDTNPAICISDTGQSRDWWLVGQGDGLTIRYADGGGSGSASNVTSAAFFKNNGNIGLGTNNPNNNLDIAVDSNHEGIRISSSTNVFGKIDFHANRSGADAALGILDFNWNGTQVARIIGGTGTDTTNKDDGALQFHTASAGTATERLRITSDGSVGINSTAPYGLFDIRGQTTEDNIFNVWSYDKHSRISLWPSDDHDADRWRMAFFENNADGNNDYPNWSLDGRGRQYMANSLYIGRARTFADAPTNLYPYYGNSGPAILITNGINGNEGGSISASLRIRCYQTDTDDRNMFYWAYTDTTSTLDDDQHQRFGVKGSGRVQGLRSFYVGRVESDETTPNSVYYGGTNGVYAYDTSGEGNARMIGYASPSTSHYSFYAETGTSTANDDIQFKVRATDGRIYSDYGASVTSGADYAESFEWHDGNPDNEDRVGYSVVLQDGKIRKALDSDNTSLIMGIISAAPAVLGDSADLKWQGRYLKDDFGREVMQDVELLVWNHGQFEPQPDINDTFRMEHCDSSCKVSEIDEKLASGEIKQWVVDQNLRITSQQRVPNPDYNSSNVYVPRSERPEWDPVGLMGKLWLRPNQPTGDRWVKLRDGDNGLTYWLVR